jgi:hypothetical protein
LSSKFDIADAPRDAVTSGTPTPDALREQAARCRRLTSSVLDRRTYDALTSMAAEYEAEAERLGQKAG